METEELRILILRIVRAVGAVGTTAQAICAQIAVEERDIKQDAVRESIQYLTDRGFLAVRQSKVSGAVRLRIAPDGLDFLESEGV